LLLPRFMPADAHSDGCLLCLVLRLLRFLLLLRHYTQTSRRLLLQQ
jgi:hypothetical protein